MNYFRTSNPEIIGFSLVNDLEISNEEGSA